MDLNSTAPLAPPMQAGVSARWLWVAIAALAVSMAALAGAWMMMPGFGAAHAADPYLARNLAATCANCHGTNGQAQPGNEPLAGGNKDEMLKKLMDFKSGAKPATIMHQLSKGYTDEQLAAIAGWFAAQKK